MIGLTSQIRRKRGALWALGVNFGVVGKTGDEAPDWNNVKATESEISNGAFFSGLTDYEGRLQAISIEVQPSSKLDAPAGLGAGLSAPSPNAWMTSYYNVGATGFTISGLDDNKLYKLTIVSVGVDAGFTTQFPVSVDINGAPVETMFTWDTDPLTDYTMALIRVPNITPSSGTIDVGLTSSGLGNLTLLFGVQIEQYSQPKPSLMPIEMFDNSVSPVPYILARKGGVGVDTPVIICLHMGGEEGDGSIDQLSRIYHNTIFKSLVNGAYNGPTDNILIACPQFYANVDNAHLLNDFITYLKGEYNVDSDKVYIMGGSAGGENALYYAGYTGRGEPFHNIAAMMVANTPLTPGYVSFGEIAASEIPIWFFSATGDNVPWIQDIVDGIINVDPDYPLRMSVFTGGDHWTPVQFIYGKRDDALPIEAGYDPYQNGEIYDWLLSH